MKFGAQHGYQTGGDASPAGRAKASYAFADAMIAESAKGQSAVTEAQAASATVISPDAGTVAATTSAADPGSTT